MKADRTHWQTVHTGRPYTLADCTHWQTVHTGRPYTLAHTASTQPHHTHRQTVHTGPHSAHTASTQPHHTHEECRQAGACAFHQRHSINTCNQNDREGGGRTANKSDRRRTEIYVDQCTVRPWCPRSHYIIIASGKLIKIIMDILVARMTT